MIFTITFARISLNERNVLLALRRAIVVSLLALKNQDRQRKSQEQVGRIRSRALALGLRHL